MSERIVVLGADGFIGREVVRALQGSGWATPVAASRRAGASASSSAANGVARVQVNATETASLQAALAGATGVVNCVAGDAGTIVNTAKALMAAAASHGTRVVDFSSMAVYGSATGVVSEDAPLLGDTGPYAAAKAEAEAIARDYARAISLRPGIVYGRGSPQWSARIAQWLLAGRVGDLGAAGDGVCNLVHVDDVVAAVLASLQTDAALGSAFNLAAPEPPSWNTYFMQYAKALGAVPVKRITGRQLKLEKLAAIPLKVLEIAARKAKLKLALPAPIPPSLPGVWRQELTLDSTRASQVLGLTWTPLAAGLAEAAAPYRRP